MAVPISPEELRAKRNSILKHQSQMESAPFLGNDERLFWQRSEDRNRGTAALYDSLGLASYEAMEALYKKANKDFNRTLVYVYVTDSSYITPVKDTIESLGFTVSRDDSTVETMLDYIDLGTKVLTGFSLITVAVSAIMIFIVTYISVVERTKEIGILRAVGGRRKDVTGLFVLESLILGAIAGVVAVGLSLFISVVANAVMSSSLSVNLLAYNAGTYFIGILISVLIIVGSGLLPSLQAANLDPVESLRTE